VPSPASLAVDHITLMYPEQHIEAISSWQNLGRAAASDVQQVWLAGDWMMVEVGSSAAVVTNTATGFKWEGKVQSRRVPWSDPCCMGMSEEWYIEQSMVIVPTPVASYTPPPCTPVAVAYSDPDLLAEAIRAAWDYVQEHHLGGGKGLAPTKHWWRGEAETAWGTMNVYKHDGYLPGWSLMISVGEQPYRSVVSSERSGFRWEGMVSPQRTCRSCICYQEFAVTELSMTKGTPTP
jgi:hypothetical protein